MCASSPLRSRRPQSGFSLVELLVALVFTSVLMAGMFRVFAASTATFSAMSDTISIQRKARWAVRLLQDEVLQVGYTMPPRIPPEFAVGAGLQPPLMFQTASPAYTPPGASGPVDELQIVSDVPLCDGTFAAATAAFDTTFQGKILNNGASIQAGDILFVQDSKAEFAKVASTAALPGGLWQITLASSEASAQNIYGKPTSGVVHATLQKAHWANAPFQVIRPLQIIRYTIVPRALDVANPSNMVPCLVRQAQPMAAGQATWSPALNTPTTDEQILLDNVIGLAVDMSIDGGKTWLRGASNDWTGISASINTALLGSASPFVKQSGGTGNGGDPMWFHYTPALFRITLQTRSAVQRTEFNQSFNAASPTAAYRIRQEVLMLSPRNFALGDPNQ